jgi:murein L,D-transpeptidase YcbB/YkuD
LESWTPRPSTELEFYRPLLSSDPVSAVQAVIDSGGVRKFVDSLKPQHPFYGKLKSALRDYRAIAAQGGWPAIPLGPTLKPGMSDTRIPVLRKRLAVTGDLEVTLANNESSTFDAPVETAVRAFQQRHGWKPDGAVGKATLAALSVPVEARIDQIRATLERCRWVMHDLPPEFVLVNVAGFQVFWIQNGENTWESAAVVGKPYTRTPTFRADMKYIVLNPTWTVPASIVRNELLPAMRRDPGYLARKRIRRINGQYVQSPGDHNALGRIKLLFPNPYAVYLHDTPSKSFFQETSRSFSHGCVRVQKPFELAALIIDDPAVTEHTLRQEVAKGKSRTITLKRSLPVLILYWTASVARDGTLRFLPDVYHRDPAIVRGLNGPLVPLKRSRVVSSASGAAE